MGAKLIHADRHTLTDMMKLKGVFCDYVNTPKNQFHLLFYGCKMWYPIVTKEHVIFYPNISQEFFPNSSLEKCRVMLQLHTELHMFCTGIFLKTDCHERHLSYMHRCQRSHKYSTATV